MKNRTVFFGILMIAFFAISGCNSTKKLTKQPTTPTDSIKQTTNLKPQNLVLWRESLKKNLTKEDVLYFYNTFEITLKGKLSLNKELEVKDGGLVSSDTTYYFTRIIPAFTTSRVYDLRRDQDGTLIEGTFWFDKNDETYRLHYMMEDYARFLEYQAKQKNPNVQLNPIGESGSFILKNDAKIIFKGKEVEAEATIKGFDDDRLWVKKTGNPAEIPSVKTATGRVDSDGPVNTNSTATQKGADVKNYPTSKGSYAPTK
ncbi:MAG: hypothetical protein NTV03_03925 [Candidatus Nomurabacteria bacterium]|nr:hypothetical protein [Candidatus Nomurabacteria bacterium]